MNILLLAPSYQSHKRNNFFNISHVRVARILRDDHVDQDENQEQEDEAARCLPPVRLQPRRHAQLQRAVRWIGVARNETYF